MKFYFGDFLGTYFFFYLNYILNVFQMIFNNPFHYFINKIDNSP